MFQPSTSEFHERVQLYKKEAHRLYNAFFRTVFSLWYGAPIDTGHWNAIFYNLTGPHDGPRLQQLMCSFWTQSAMTVPRRGGAAECSLSCVTCLGLADPAEYVVLGPIEPVRRLVYQNQAERYLVLSQRRIARSRWVKMVDGSRPRHDPDLLVTAYRQFSYFAPPRPIVFFLEQVFVDYEAAPDPASRLGAAEQPLVDPTNRVGMAEEQSSRAFGLATQRMRRRKHKFRGRSVGRMPERLDWLYRLDDTDYCNLLLDPKFVDNLDHYSAKSSAYWRASWASAALRAYKDEEEEEEEEEEERHVCWKSLCPQSWHRHGVGKAFALARLSSSAKLVPKPPRRRLLLSQPKEYRLFWDGKMYGLVHFDGGPLAGHYILRARPSDEWATSAAIKINWHNELVDRQWTFLLWIRSLLPLGGPLPIAE
ncbi:MAG: hypothetical protein E6Q06_01850 [Candidatus Moraniibacteriota bacterium]|nr:MAG: hypothetical protein E6Q06_01850 [Candidatus Moranbacteria bacterium]